jgi:hypothetical protein
MHDLTIKLLQEWKMKMVNLVSKVWLAPWQKSVSPLWSIKLKVLEKLCAGPFFSAANITNLSST